MYMIPVGVFVLGSLAIAAVALVIGAWKERRERVITRQIELTDAIHAELGAAAAPVVSKRAFGPWRVTYLTPLARTAAVERLVTITHSTLARAGASDVEIVFAPRPRALRAA